MLNFLEKHWITKPSDYDEIDPETKMGLITYLDMESKKVEKEQLKAEAQEALSKLKARSSGL